eukprot:TRINITY_DN7736_c0_g1_i2.p1 TRINITY_DN7736_c0_g1~~TRINITY_DN7736_c0_g1_i2.p1  ORF type:complete len:399 (+),score=52.79 TRINITY_DN7736_c0_g1_i2:276-1472(+)
MQEKERKCGFWLPSRRRYCNGVPTGDNILCGHHSKSRIPCPFDPSHTVDKDKIEKHKKKCPVGKRLLAIQSQGFYSQGVNLMKENEPKSCVTLKQFPTSQLIPIITEFQKGYSAVKTKYKITKFHEELSPALAKEHEIKQKMYLERFIQNDKLKHATQKTSILAYLDIFGLLTDECEYIEFGAGKGGLSDYLRQTVATHLLLIDRGNFRNKNERRPVEDCQAICERICIDISDLDLAKVPYLLSRQPKRKLVVVGKHLCGGGFDVSLQCIRQYNEQRPNDKIAAIAISLCCHNQCSWSAYVNTNYIENELNMTQKNFELMTLMSGWGISGIAVADPNKVFEKDRVDRARVGKKCKNALNFGRIIFLKEMGYETHLYRYCPPKVSQENTLLIATLADSK